MAEVGDSPDGGRLAVPTGDRRPAHSRGAVSPGRAAAFDPGDSFPFTACEYHHVSGSRRASARWICKDISGRLHSLIVRSPALGALLCLRDRVLVDEPNAGAWHAMKATCRKERCALIRRSLPSGKAFFRNHAPDAAWSQFQFACSLFNSHVKSKRIMGRHRFFSALCLYLFLIIRAQVLEL